VNAFDFDPTLFADFLDESLDSLAPLDRIVLDLASDGQDFTSLAAIFRPIHSLKGNASFFRLLSTRRLAHALEDVLDALRTRRMDTAPKSLLLDALAELRNTLASARSGIVPDEGAIDDLVAKLKACQCDSIPEPATEVGHVPVEVSRLATLLESPPPRTLPAEAANPLREVVLALATKAPPGSEASRIVAQCQETLDTILPVLGYDPVLRDLLLEKIALLESADWSSPLPLRPGRETHQEEGRHEPRRERTDSAPEHADANPADRTMRIPERSIDKFLGFVGELVVVEEVFQYLNRQVSQDRASLDDDFVSRLKQNTDTFAVLSRSLRESILQLRRLPARQVLQKVPRLAHDAAGRCGKSVKVEIKGEEIELDKSHLDLLDAPITHLVNNAVDHGIEGPERRLAAGKPEVGTVSVEVREGPDHLVLEIRDDGAGLDFEALRRKGLEMGLVQEGQELSRDRIVELLFQPGLSTAAAVTEISGRGVGMDVVRRQILSTGGRIEVESRSGQGALFRVILPHSVRTQIIEGFVVGVGVNSYLFPLGLVREVFPLDPSAECSIPGKGCVLLHQDALVPLVRLGNLLGSESIDRDPAATSTVVVVQVSQGRLALVVDEVLGIRKTVIKPLGAVGGESDLYEGVGMMGDGSMSLILGSEGLGRLAREHDIPSKVG
jgi:two-component system chemotaxis sensor kinase CheA